MTDTLRILMAGDLVLDELHAARFSDLARATLESADALIGLDGLGAGSQGCG